MRVILHIDELVLHGTPAHERHALGDIVREALTRRLQAGSVADWPRGGAGIDLLRAPMRPAAGLQGRGEAIAAAVHGAVVQGVGVGASGTGRARS
jgi:hypothetical protein